jgi:hypothetical protein
MVNYENGKIYKITSKHHPLPYYGSTCDELRKRLYKHKEVMISKRNKISSRQLLELGDYKIELVEKFPCKNKNELLKRESYYIKNFDCINKVIPTITKKERKEYEKKYRDTHKEQQKEYMEQWTKDNHDKILKDKKIYWEKNKEEFNKIITCDCGGTYQARNKNRHLKTKNCNVPIKCECGGTYKPRESMKQRHFNSKKHKKFLQSQ